MEAPLVVLRESEGASWRHYGQVIDFMGSKERPADCINRGASDAEAPPTERRHARDFRPMRAGSFEVLTRPDDKKTQADFGQGTFREASDWPSHGKATPQGVAFLFGKESSGESLHRPGPGAASKYLSGRGLPE